MIFFGRKYGRSFYLPNSKRIALRIASAFVNLFCSQYSSKFLCVVSSSLTLTSFVLGSPITGRPVRGLNSITSLLSSIIQYYTFGTQKSSTIFLKLLLQCQLRHTFYNAYTVDKVGVLLYNVMVFSMKGYRNIYV